MNEDVKKFIYLYCRRSMNDLIGRQAAIDVLEMGEEFLNRVLDSADIVGAERAKYEWGLGLIESYISDMKELPSAQPEIVRCKDCKWWNRDPESVYGYCMAIKHGFYSSNWEIGIYRKYKGDFYCADAERRTG